MKRRQFIVALGSAVAWPAVARAQQVAVPAIGYLTGRSPDIESRILAAFRQGLKETGYVEGQNIAIEYRFASGKVEQLRRWRSTCR
jgi:putative ABC transport system substrate-binding protein